MNKFTAIAFVTLSTATVHAAATVERVIVRQQWPWSTDVKVEYTLSGLAENERVDLGVQIYDGTTLIADSTAEGSDLAKHMRGDIYAVSRGAGTFTIDPVGALGKSRGVIADFKVRLSASVSQSAMYEELYRIYDLADGSFESISRADIMNRPDKYGSYETDFAKIGPGFNTTLPSEEIFIWTGVTNNPVYKTDKLVMRRIPAQGREWLTSVSGSRRYVKLTNDYFIAVFETTQPQWTKIYGTNYSTMKDAANADFLPAEGMKSGEVIGFRQEWVSERDGTTGYHHCYVTSSEIWNWPNNAYLHDVDKKSFMKLLWDKTGYEFYLPTQAQWEYACRAGAMTDYNSGKNITWDGGVATPESEEIAKEVAWVQLNAAEPQPVGTKACNAFGLYDMHGNVAEMCAGAGTIASGHDGVGLTEDDPIIEPIGTASTYETKRGGAFSADGFGGWTGTTSTALGQAFTYNQSRGDMGFRLVCPVGKQWTAH